MVSHPEKEREAWSSHYHTCHISIDYEKHRLILRFHHKMGISYLKMKVEHFVRAMSIFFRTSCTSTDFELHSTIIAYHYRPGNLALWELLAPFHLKHLISLI
jgi:hypothetical protein